MGARGSLKHEIYEVIVTGTEIRCRRRGVGRRRCRKPLEFPFLSRLSFRAFRRCDPRWRENHVRRGDDRAGGGGDDDNNFGSAIHRRGSVGASGSSMSLLGFGNEFIEPSSSSSCSRLITTLLAKEDDDEYFRMGGDLWPFCRGLIVLNRLGSFFGVMPSVPLGVNSGDSEAV